MPNKEIDILDIEQYIGKPIWFEDGDRKSKPRILSKCVNGLPFSFDKNKEGGGYYVSFDSETIKTVKIFTF